MGYGGLCRGLTAALAVTMIASVFAQEKPPVPRPFPTPAEPATPPKAAPAAPAAAPGEAALGVPMYPGAQFLTSYDASRGQRFHIYGASATFAEVVAFYRSALKQRGSVLFEEPPTHTFEVGRFRESTMEFPSGVTIKDYTWGGMRGYTNPRRDGRPPSFPTVIQVVPPSPGDKGP